MASADDEAGARRILPNMHLPTLRSIPSRSNGSQRTAGSDGHGCDAAIFSCGSTHVAMNSWP